MSFFLLAREMMFQSSGYRNKGRKGNYVLSNYILFNMYVSICKSYVGFHVYIAEIILYTFPYVLAPSAFCYDTFCVSFVSFCQFSEGIKCVSG